MNSNLFLRGFWLGLLSHGMGRHLSGYALWRMGDQELREHDRRTHQRHCPACAQRHADVLAARPRVEPPPEQPIDDT
jgi:hypothetical protein